VQTLEEHAHAHLLPFIVLLNVKNDDDEVTFGTLVGIGAKVK
jgi:hypothetical protein